YIRKGCPTFRYCAAEVQNYLWQYRNRPIGAVSMFLASQANHNRIPTWTSIARKTYHHFVPLAHQIACIQWHIHNIWV
ncbi:hypothetical protein ASPFODRAFT_54928, partial [Aspergillus luchuensis CBS 106.47]